MRNSLKWLDVMYPVERFDQSPPLRDLATVLRGEWARSHISSFVACVGGGVFLATCMLDLLPGRLLNGVFSYAIESFEKTKIESAFPVAEAAVALGLLLVLSIEQTVLAMQERGWLSSSHVHLHNEPESSREFARPMTPSDESDHDPNSMLGACLLVLALSLHALFEGLSLAVISDASKLLEVFAALILHKCIIGFSLGVRLVQSGMRTPWVALCACIFSIQVLIGGLGGMEIMSLLSGGDRETAALVSCILQGIACGTFLYITTFEVLPHELDKAGNRMSKLFFLFIGVAIVISFMLLFPEAE
ncbi:unnamed protein product [Nippostrongylus brasiliensis]|uniref:Putative zinc/iron transporter (inferred by orthology to a S. mansoni protein) n=1 Tax=Nippostrongylus brasiliensis TaxID=27835 RepID=A0A0N4XZF5_NIPBR|nr:unnamed protein product [Nippostrongylus brasiliensis]